jgi:hypothetical protein
MMVLIGSLSAALCGLHRGTTTLIHRSAWKGISAMFGFLLSVAVMFADGALVLLVGPDMRVHEGRRALHSLLVHP